MKESIKRSDELNEPTTRIVYWDVAKCLLMYLVVLGHVVQLWQYGNVNFWEDGVFKAIYMFHMPCFILISGYFAGKTIQEATWKTLPKYARRLLLPGITFGCFWLLLRMTCGAAAPLNILQIAKAASPFWFLIILFECVCFFILFSLPSSKIFKTTMIILPLFLALAISELPKNLQHFFPHNSWFAYYWPFFLLGAAMRHYRISPENMKHASLWGCIFCVLYVVSFYYFPHQWTVYQKAPTLNLESLTINGIRTLVAVIGCGAFLFTIKVVTFMGKYAIIRLLGAATMGLYVLQSCIFTLRSTYMHYLPENMGYGWSCFLSLVLMLLLYAIYALTSQIKWMRLLLYGERS
ncbi:MAG: acyltransferase [Akkermansia sp.]|nr:acyltransferase [Akkermansia sp.]